MDWRDDDADVDDPEAAFVLVHEGPKPAPGAKPAKGAKGKAGTARVEELERSLLLAAYPALRKDESEAGRLARAAAATRCWDALAGQIEETLEGTDAAVFDELLAWARQAHRPPAPRPSSLPAFAGCERLPAALVLAGGVNSADHCRTFPRLAAFLRGSGCHAALLHAHSFGSSPGEAIGEILRQLSGLPVAKEEHMAALQQWYQDETGGDRGAPAAEVPPGEPGASADGGRLRVRPPAIRAGGATAEQLAARGRPLVLVVEGTESVDPRCLRDFLLTASEVYQDVPLTLVLGLTTTADALHELLPSDVVDRCLQLCHFKLASATSRLNSLVQRVLLGGSGRWPGLLFSNAVIGSLIDAFLNHYYSTGCITQGLKVAALAHFRSQPLSALAAAALEGGREGVEATCESLDATALAEARSQLGARTRSDVAQLVCEAMAGWSAWAVGVQWLVVAAEAAGLLSLDFSPSRLVHRTLRQDFAVQQLPQLLDKLQPALRRLPAPRVRALADALRAAAGAVAGGAAAAAEQLRQLAEFEAEEQDAPAAPPVEQQQQQQQQQPAQDSHPADAPDQAGGGDAQSAGSRKKKKLAFHSKDSRRDFLQKVAQEAARKGGGAAAAAAAKAREAVAPGARLAGWLAGALRVLMATAPTRLPGAVIFTCRDASSLACLTAEPRASLHAALTEPGHFLGLPGELGVGSHMEDACLAFSLLDQDTKCYNLADWYAAFEAVHLADGGGPRKKAAVKKAKRARGSGAADASAEAPGGGEAASPAQAARHLLAARFSQATAELQYVGLIKPAKRRRGDCVQRLVHQPATGE